MDKPREIAKVPQNLEDLLEFKAMCGCGRMHSVDLAFASIRPGAIDDLVDFTRKVGPPKRVLVVADAITRQVLGDTARALLDKAGFQTQLLELPDGEGGRPHADEKALELVESAMKGFDLAVAVGSGTVNDLTKLGSFNLGLPYISVATAPSMNGYTSAIAAIMIRGVKHTVECHQPIGVVADLDILSKSPHHLIASGLGDLESKPTSTADYRLGGLLNRSYYCSAPERVVLAAEAKAAASAEGLASSDPDAISALTEALVLSGISMKLAGSSSPASGGEHLISHYWDMTAKDENRIEGWHGSQVGVATIVTATLYEYLKNTDPKTLDFERLLTARPSREAVEQAIKQRHGSRFQEVAGEFFKKRLDEKEFRRELKWIEANWSILWSDLGDVLRPPGKIKHILSSAKAPVNVTDIGLSSDHLKRAFVAAREIRGRYTVLDLAADLGLLESSRDEILDASGCLH